MPIPSSAPDGSPEFLTTHWSMVARAGNVDEKGRSDALEILCKTYWFPLYAYVRRRGFDVEEAKDLTQGFFAVLLAKNYVGDADRDRGRFRTFLLTSLGHFLANEWDRATAKKRGGGMTWVSLDEMDAEGRYRVELVDGITPESLYDRSWAQAVMEVVLKKLRLEYDDQGRGVKFDELKRFLTGTGPAVNYEDLATNMGISSTGARSVVHRLRKRFATLMREEIAKTVTSEEEAEGELRHLLSSLEM